MTLEEVKPQFMAGAKIRREGWSMGSFLTKDEGVIRMKDVWATDWEIMEAPGEILLCPCRNCQCTITSKNVEDLGDRYAVQCPVCNARGGWGNTHERANMFWEKGNRL